MTEMKTYFYDLVPIEYEATDSEREHILSQYPSPSLPTNEDLFDIQNEATGNNISVRVLLSDFKVHITKANKQFIRATFCNNSGMINAVLWDNNGEVAKYKPLLEEYAVFDVTGKVTEFNSRKSLTISSLKPFEEEVNPFSLLPYTKQSISELTVELMSYLGELQSPYKEITFGAMDRFWSQFRIRPAAKGYHHNYLGGLLKHTVGLMRFARYITKLESNPYQAIIKLIAVVEKAYKSELWSQFQSENKEQLVWKDTIDHLYSMLQRMMEHKETEPNYDVLMTSILFHDIGKLLEYDHAGNSNEVFKEIFPTADHSVLEQRKQAGISMDELGVMVGHIPYGPLFLTKVIELEDIKIPLEDIHQVAHCILCHHGLPEWGSCVRTPQTIDGYIIHIVDFLDSRYENTEKVK